MSIFSPTELELLICGLPDVSIDELQQHTDYHQYKATDESIVWFWEALRSFNREERASFLQFVTGTSKVSVVLLFLDIVATDATTVQLLLLLTD